MKPSMEETTVVILLLSGLSTSDELSSKYHYVNLKKNWAEAQSYCRQEFSDLATVNNADDNERLLTHALNSPNRVSSQTWIGLYDDIDHWKWSMDDENIYVHRDNDFLTWERSQPDNIHGKEHCVSCNTRMEMNDRHCENSFPFMCYDAKNATSYIVVGEQRNWTGAQAYCREHHTDLVNIRSREENERIQLALNTQNPSGVRHMWIGLYREPWASWSDNSTSTFTKWARNQPNNHRSYQYCASLSVSSRKWSDDNCGLRLAFFCIQEVKKGTVLKMMIQSTAHIDRMKVQRQVLQQLQANMVSKGLTNFRLHWRQVQHCRMGTVTAPTHCDWI